MGQKWHSDSSASEKACLAEAERTWSLEGVQATSNFSCALVASDHEAFMESSANDCKFLQSKTDGAEEQTVRLAHLRYLEVWCWLW